MSVLVGTDPDGGVDAALAQVGAALDSLLLATDGELSAAVCERVIECVERHARRLSGVRLRVLAAAARARAADRAGFASTEAWAARRTRMPRAAAARQVALAGELESGHDATAAALDQGLLSPAHAAVIVGASRALPGGPRRRSATSGRGDAGG